MFLRKKLENNIFRAIQIKTNKQYIKVNGKTAMEQYTDILKSLGVKIENVYFK